jgi:ribA/ribD-fused uncharacterized protein
MIDSFTKEFRFLSNYARYEFVIDGKHYISNEHFFQASKCKKLEDHEKVRLSSFKEVKKLGRSMELRDDWDEVKDSIMEEGLLAKFNQNLGAKALLLATGDQELIEGNWWNDTYWGVCRGVGKNKLGILLMKVRDDIRIRM